MDKIAEAIKNLVVHVITMYTFVDLKMLKILSRPASWLRDTHVMQLVAKIFIVVAAILLVYGSLASMVFDHSSTKIQAVDVFAFGCSLYFMWGMWFLILAEWKKACKTKYPASNVIDTEALARRFTWTFLLFMDSLISVFTFNVMVDWASILAFVLLIVTSALLCSTYTPRKIKQTITRDVWAHVQSKI